MIDVTSIKAEFPIFQQATPHGNRLVYLDNAATCQKPQAVIDMMIDFYQHHYGTVGRSSYWPASAASKQFTETRKAVQHFLKAEFSEEIIFTAGATDGINKLANSFVRPRLNEGDEILVSAMEHHANLLPWQNICHEKGATLKVIPMLDSGDLGYESLPNLLSEKTKFMAVTAVSNALGAKNDLNRLISAAQEWDVPVLVDAAQSVAHDAVNVLQLDCDFLVFSGHKLYGPTGVGVLYGKRRWLEKMAPLSFGGGIVKEVNLASATFREIPHKHEAGTPNIAGVLGLGVAIHWIEKLGMEAMHQHTTDLTQYALEQLSALEGINIIGSPKHKAPVVSFTVDGIHPHDLSTFLSEKGICIRAGHHCAQPLMKHFNLPATARISFAVYNDHQDIDSLMVALIEAQKFFL